MESSPSPNLANLNQVFNQNDNDHDGKVNDQQIDKILKEVGYNDIYIGTIKKIIRLLNIQQPDNQTLDFPQLQEFAQALTTKGKFEVWKSKYQLKKSLAEIHGEIFGQPVNQAAPGAGPGSNTGPGGPTLKNQVTSQQGQISLNIGNQNIYEQYISFSLDKQKGKQSIFLNNQVKPFVKLSIQTNSNEQALKIQKIFKNMYDTVIQLVKAEQQDMISEILSVSFITSVKENSFNLFVTTNNQGLIELVQLTADFLDLMIKQPTNGKIEGSYKFNFDFSKFLSDPNYNFYDLFVKNCSFNLKWNVWDLFKNLREILIKAKAFQNLKWDSMDPTCLFLIGLLHCQKFRGKLQFQNTSSDNQETKSKEQLVDILKQIKQNLKGLENDTQLTIFQLIEQITGKIVLQAGVSDWRLNFEAQLGNVSKLFTSSLQEAISNQDNDSNGNDVPFNQVHSLNKSYQSHENNDKLSQNSSKKEQSCEQNDQKFKQE